MHVYTNKILIIQRFRQISELKIKFPTHSTLKPSNQNNKDTYTVFFFNSFRKVYMFFCDFGNFYHRLRDRFHNSFNATVFEPYLRVLTFRPYPHRAFHRTTMRTRRFTVETTHGAAKRHRRVAGVGDDPARTHTYRSIVPGRSAVTGCVRAARVPRSADAAPPPPPQVCPSAHTPVRAGTQAPPDNNDHCHIFSYPRRRYKRLIIIINVLPPPASPEPGERERDRNGERSRKRTKEKKNDKI